MLYFINITRIDYNINLCFVQVFLFISITIPLIPCYNVSHRKKEVTVMKNDKVNMLSGSIVKGLIAMTIPIMIMNVAQVLFNIVDMTVLRIFGKESGVGAVGACGTLITLTTSLLIGLAAGANVVIARRLGAKNRQCADRAVITAILVAITGGILLTILGITEAETFLKMTNCPESLIGQATMYFRVHFCSMLPLMLYNFCAAILRATGDTKRPMKFLILGSIIKLVFTVVFVAFFDASCEGVAGASIISSTVIAILAFRALQKNGEISRVEIRKLRFYGTELKEILFMGIPAGLQSSLYSFANVIITAAVNSFGADATTGIAIANQFDGVLYQISYAPSLAVIPYIAQNMGAGNIDRVKKTITRATLITIAFGATFGSLSAIFSAQLSSIMTSSPAVIAYSRQKMMLISSTYFICGINEIMGGVLKGMGKPIFPTVATLVYMCLLRFVWVYQIFPHFRNLTFLYLVWPIGWILSIITLSVIIFPKIRKLQKEAKEKILV